MSLSIYLRFPLLALLFSSPFLSMAHAEPETTDAKFTVEKTISFDYVVNCDEAAPSTYPAVSGTVTYHNRIYRFDLFKYLSHSEISLGALPESVTLDDLKIQIDSSTTSDDANGKVRCALNSFTPTLHTENTAPPNTFLKLFQNEPPSTARETQLAFLHSPFLMVRSDEFYNREMDVPMGLTYSVSHPFEGTVRIVYTMFFSNETVHGIGSTSKLKSLAAYGRRTDVEWLYQVDLDAKTETIQAQRYASAIIFSWGHSSRAFRGQYLPNSFHPILYNIATHNIFSDSPTHQQKKHALEGYLLTPREEIQDPNTREDWMWNHAWTFDVSDRELLRDGNLAAPSSDYLYVLFDGKLNRGEIEIVNLTSPEAISFITNMGKDLWHEQTMSAIHLKSDFKGSLLIRPKSWRKTQFELLHQLKFFRLVVDANQGFTTLDVTNSYHCDGTQLPMVCSTSSLPDQSQQPMPNEVNQQ